MSLRVLTAVTNATREAELVTALQQSEIGVTIVRRCFDVADLLSTATTGTARAVVLSSDLRRLNRSVLVQLNSAKVGVVGLVDPGDDAAHARLKQLGIRHVLPSDTPVEEIARTLTEAVSSVVGGPVRGVADPTASYAQQPAPPSVSEALATASPPLTGSVVAVWGPTGAPGRSTVSLGLADEASRSGVQTFLVDADTYGSSIAQMIGLMDESPGIAAAARLDNQGSLDLPHLISASRTLTPALRVLTGVTRSDRWIEVQADAVRGILEKSRTLAPLTVVDCGFCIEDDEELSYDTVAPRRNGATLAALDDADIVLVIGQADPVGIIRLTHALTELMSIAPAAAERARVVINKLRPGPTGSHPQKEIQTALKRFSNVTHAQYLPWDLEACDASLLGGKTLAEVAPNSPLRESLKQLSALVIASLQPV